MSLSSRLAHRSTRLRLLLPLAGFLSASLSLAQKDAPAGALLNSRALAVNSATRKVYAVDEGNNRITIFNTETNKLSTVAVGKAPDSLTVNATTGRIYVANSGDGTITVLDGKSDKVLTTLKGARHPYTIAADEGANLVYVANTFSNEISILNGVDNTIQTRPLGSADNIVVDSKRHRVFFLGYEDGQLRILHSDTGTVERLVLGVHVWGMALNDVSGTLYVTRTGDKELVAVHVDSSLKRFPTGSIPSAVAVDGKRDRIYVANYEDDSLTILEEPTGKVVGTIKVGHRPQAVAVDTATNRIYVANTHSGTVSVIDGNRIQPLATVKAGKAPYAIAVPAHARRVYVANLGSPSFHALDLPENMEAR